MSILDTITNNTILVPYHDSLVSSNPLPETTIGKKVQAFNKNFDEFEKIEATLFSLYMVSGGKSVMAGLCEKVSGLTVNRKVDEQRSGGNSGYTVKLPGPLSYAVVSISHLYCNNDLFLEWMINGSDRGGVQKADIELHVGPEKKEHMVYTLRDAFPTEWHLGTMNINAEGLITNKETITYVIDSSQLMVENMKIAYGRLDHKLMK